MTGGATGGQGRPTASLDQCTDAVGEGVGSGDALGGRHARRAHAPREATSILPHANVLVTSDPCASAH